MGAIDDDPGLPLKLWPCSNGEYLPPPLDELRAEAMRRARAAADDHARRHGWSRRRFLLSSAGMAAGLRRAARRAAADRARRRSASSRGGVVPASATTAGHATRPRPTTSSHGTAGAAPASSTCRPTSSSSATWGDGLPAGGVRRGRPDRLLLGRVLARPRARRQRHVGGGDLGGPGRRRGRPAVDRRDGARPGARRRAVRRRPGADPGPRRARRRSARRRARVDGRRRRGPRAVRVEGVHARARTAGSSTTTTRRVPQVGAPFLQAVRDTGVAGRRRAQGPVRRQPVRLAGRHRPGGRGQPRPALPRVPLRLRDRRTPRVRTTPTAPASTGSCAASTEAGIGAGGNVYAELGSTWRTVMGDPDEAAHVLGKLLVAFGPERILWGTDSIWYGSPQDQIAAFRAFEITPGVPGAVRLPGADRRGQAADPRPPTPPSCSASPCPRRPASRRHGSRRSVGPTAPRAGGTPRRGRHVPARAPLDRRRPVVASASLDAAARPEACRAVPAGLHRRAASRL